jgi:hypothetical protein
MLDKQDMQDTEVLQHHTQSHRKPPRHNFQVSVVATVADQVNVATVEVSRRDKQAELDFHQNM